MRADCDPFDQLLGPSRGLSDPVALSAKLIAAEREAVQLAGELNLVREQRRVAERRADALFDNLSELEVAHVSERAAHIACKRDRDCALYIAVAACAAGDIYVEHTPEHHGVWTPGRPYLGNAHAWSPSTGVCFSAKLGGAAAGRRPGRSARWERCAPDVPCPTPVPVDPEPHQATGGYALRQADRWWDKHKREWTIREADATELTPPLTREHLLGVVDFLLRHCERFYYEEMWRYPRLVPCPAHAYAPYRDPHLTWLHDTPLMNALLAEKARRRIRRSPGWQWAEDF
jgi:hypothetical protein